MKVTEVTRTISGSNYSNISATAMLGETDTIKDIASALDSQLEEALSNIETKKNNIRQRKIEIEETTDLLQTAIEYAKSQELPF